MSNCNIINSKLSIFIASSTVKYHCNNSLTLYFFKEKLHLKTNRTQGKNKYFPPKTNDASTYICMLLYLETTISDNMPN